VDRAVRHKKEGFGLLRDVFYPPFSDETPYLIVRGFLSDLYFIPFVGKLLFQYIAECGLSRSVNAFNNKECPFQKLTAISISYDDLIPLVFMKTPLRNQQCDGVSYARR